jgi:hypothetical protein
MFTINDDLHSEAKEEHHLRKYKIRTSLWSWYKIPDYNSAD